jgi:hypothetical protein
LTVSSYRDKDNRKWWEFNKRHKGQRKHERRFRTKEAAQNAERAWVNLVDAQKSGTALDMTVKQLAVKCLNIAGGSISPPPSRITNLLFGASSSPQ